MKEVSEGGPVGHAKHTAVGEGDVAGVADNPLLPSLGLGMSRLEREPAAVPQGTADRRQRGADLLIRDQALEGVARHRRQLELALPGDVGGRALDPLDVLDAPRPAQ